jgi:hypothetical protein
MDHQTYQRVLATKSWAVFTLIRGLAIAFFVICVILQIRGMEIPNWYLAFPLIAFIDAAVRVVFYNKWEMAHYTVRLIHGKMGKKMTMEECVANRMYTNLDQIDEDYFDTFQAHWLIKKKGHEPDLYKLDDFWSISWKDIWVITNFAESQMRLLMHKSGIFDS